MSDVLKKFNGHLSEMIISTINNQHFTHEVDGITASELASILGTKHNISKEDTEFCELTEVIGKRLSQLRTQKKVHRLPKRRGRQVVYYINRPMRQADSVEERKRRATDVEESGAMSSLKVMIQSLSSREIAHLSSFVNDLLVDKMEEVDGRVKRAMVMLNDLESEIR